VKRSAVFSTQKERALEVAEHFENPSFGINEKSSNRATTLRGFVSSHALI
jgi:hypothetical protein